MTSLSKMKTFEIGHFKNKHFGLHLELVFRYLEFFLVILLVLPFQLKQLYISII